MPPPPVGRPTQIEACKIASVPENDRIAFGLDDVDAHPELLQRAATTMAKLGKELVTTTIRQFRQQLPAGIAIALLTLPCRSTR